MGHYPHLCGVAPTGVSAYNLAWLGLRG